MTRTWRSACHATLNLASTSPGKACPRGTAICYKAHRCMGQSKTNGFKFPRVSGDKIKSARPLYSHQTDSRTHEDVRDGRLSLLACVGLCSHASMQLLHTHSASRSRRADQCSGIRGRLWDFPKRPRGVLQLHVLRL